MGRTVGLWPSTVGHTGPIREVPGPIRKSRTGHVCPTVEGHNPTVFPITESLQGGTPWRDLSGIFPKGPGLWDEKDSGIGTLCPPYSIGVFRTFLNLSCKLGPE